MLSIPLQWPILIGLLVIKLTFHLYVNTLYGFHRDEYLFLAQGRHLAWGYWSVPPAIGFKAWLLQQTLGDSVFSVRLVPTIFTIALVAVMMETARTFGAGRYGQFLAGFTALLSPAMLRSGILFQPVALDIFVWGLTTYWVARFLQRPADRWLYLAGVTIGLGLLNKYLPAFLLISLALALGVTSHRNVFLRLAFWVSGLLALLMWSPNLWWQYRNNFPVRQHMADLAATQLVNMQPFDFVKDQFFLNGLGWIVWLPGLIWLLRSKSFRTLGYTFLFTFAIFLLASGKSYYTLGLYPMAIAAGGVWWEKLVMRRPWTGFFPPVLIAGFALIILPVAVPMLPPKLAQQYYQRLIEDYHFTGPFRWENGGIRPMPQDFADMLGWDELGILAGKAYQQALVQGDRPLVYGDSYGHAGAAWYFNRRLGMPEPVSFSDSYVLWLPEKTDANALIYMNDELGKGVATFFGDIQLIGRVRHPLARISGDGVWLCRRPKGDVEIFWQELVIEVRKAKGIH